MINAAKVMILVKENKCAEKLEKTLKQLGYLVTGIAEPDTSSVEKALQLKADIILMDLTSDNDNYFENYNPQQVDCFPNIKPIKQIKSKMLPVVCLVSNYNTPSSFEEIGNFDGVGYFCLLNKAYSKRQLKTTIDLAIDSRSKHHQPPYPFSDILNKYSKDLVTLLSELQIGNIAELSLNLLIKVCYELARANVKRKISKISNVNKRWDLSIEDIAVESISNLFVNNSKHKKLNLQCFLNNWTDNISDNTDALFFLNKIANICVDQYMNKLLRESDPFFAKTIDTFYLAIKKMNYTKIDHFGTIYIAENGIESFPPSVSLIPAEEFMRISFNNIRDKKDLLEYIMTYLDSRTEYFPAIPLNLLVERFLNYNQVNHTSSDTMNDLERISVDDIVYKSLEMTITKMKDTYLKADKLSIIEADYIAAALTDVAFDFREGNTIVQLQDYLATYIKDLSVEEYKAKYRNIFEYMIKIFKKSLAGNLRQ